MERLRLGTRGSKLARLQCGIVQQRLREQVPELETEVVVIETSGDRNPQVRSGAENLKALFVKEIEEALLEGRIDAGVHSAKDLPQILPGGLHVPVYLRREDPRDAYLGRGPGQHWESLPQGASLATSSMRRQAQMRSRRPDLLFRAMRGNVDTRMRKLESGEVDGTVLAVAGLRRLGVPARRYQVLPLDVFVPSAGQGAIALEVRPGDAAVERALKSIHDETSALEVGMERECARLMGSGCTSPFGASARAGPSEVHLRLFAADPDGSRPRWVSGQSSRDPERCAVLIRTLCGRLQAK